VHTSGSPPRFARIRSPGLLQGPFANMHERFGLLRLRLSGPGRLQNSPDCPIDYTLPDRVCQVRGTPSGASADNLKACRDSPASACIHGNIAAIHVSHANNTFLLRRFCGLGFRDTVGGRSHTATGADNLVETQMQRCESTLNCYRTEILDGENETSINSVQCDTSDDACLR